MVETDTKLKIVKKAAMKQPACKRRCNQRWVKKRQDGKFKNLGIRSKRTAKTHFKVGNLEGRYTPHVIISVAVCFYDGTWVKHI